MIPDEVVEAAAAAICSQHDSERYWSQARHNIRLAFAAALAVTDSEGVPVLLRPWLEQVGWMQDRLDLHAHGIRGLIETDPTLWCPDETPEQRAEFHPPVFRVVERKP